MAKWQVLKTTENLEILKTSEHLDFLPIPNSSFEDPEVHKTKEAIEFFTRLGNRYNISHVAQVCVPSILIEIHISFDIKNRYNISHVAQAGLLSIPPIDQIQIDKHTFS